MVTPEGTPFWLAVSLRAVFVRAFARSWLRAAVTRLDIVAKERGNARTRERANDMKA
jgi:hypothetical protein